MWKFLNRLLGSSDIPSDSKGPEIPEQSHKGMSTEPLNLFWSKVAHLSNTEHRFLHPTYSPSSRIPCADFTPFIIDRLQNHDVVSIQTIMRAVIAVNPGLGTGSEWIDQSVEEVVALDFSRYCNSVSPEFYLELKALFILGSKEGCGREFWLADEKPLLFALALCCRNIRWLDSMEQLREKANRFIRKMRKQTPFWIDYPLFGAHAIESISMAPRLASILSGLPLMSRVHLLSLADNSCASLMRATTYKMRSLGLNPLETAPLLLASGVCELTTDLEAIADVFSKNDLITALTERDVPFRKSWKKSQLLEELFSHAPDFITQVAEREKTARIKPEFLSELHSMSTAAKVMQENIKLLCFADSDNL